MSIKPVRYCTAKDCNQLHRNKKYCNDHQYLLNRHLNKKEASKERSIYNNQSWRNYSKRFRAERIICVNFRECKGLAELVDHIVPIEEGGDMWLEFNHQPMCHACHNRKRQAEAMNARRGR